MVVVKTNNDINVCVNNLLLYAIIFNVFLGIGRKPCALRKRFFKFYSYVLKICNMGTRYYGFTLMCLYVV